MPRRDATVYLVEDDISVLEALSFQLKTVGYKTAEFADAETFLGKCSPSPTDCLVTDVRLPGMDGVGLIDELNKRNGRPPTIVITAYPQVPLVVEAMRLGAVDFLEKPLHGTTIVSAVERAVSGASTTKGLRDEAMKAAALLRGLSERERDIFDRFVEGSASKQIASDLAISPKTVETYRLRLYEKLGVITPNGLARLGTLALMFPMWEPISS